VNNNWSLAPKHNKEAYVMRTLLNYFYVIFRLVKKPQLLPHLGRLLTGKLGRIVAGVDLGNIKKIERFGGEEWAAKNAADKISIYRELDITESVESFRNKFQDEISKAELELIKCTERMGGAGNIELLYALAEKIDAKKALETGVAAGWSSFGLLQSLSKRGGMLWSIDLPYLAFNNEDCVGVTVPLSLRENWKLYKMADREGLPKALKEAGKIDLAHYDSDKSIEGRLFAYPLMWSALRSGGILVSDDISDNIAFAYFSDTVNVKPLIIRDGNKYQGILIKP
jgi:predicted O-methyltransferase YrrM